MEQLVASPRRDAKGLSTPRAATKARYLNRRTAFALLPLWVGYTLYFSEDSEFDHAADCRQGKRGPARAEETGHPLLGAEGEGAEGALSVSASSMRTLSLSLMAPSSAL